MKKAIVVMAIIFASCGNKVEKHYITSMDSSFALKGEMSKGQLDTWANDHLRHLNTVLTVADTVKRKVAIDSLLVIHNQVIFNFTDSSRNPIFKK